MTLELLFDLPSGAVPDDGRLVDAAAEQQVALPVPLEREDGPLVGAQHVLQLPCITTRAPLSKTCGGCERLATTRVGIKFIKAATRTVRIACV